MTVRTSPKPIAASLFLTLVGAGESLAAQSAEVNGVVTDSASSQPVMEAVLQLVELENVSDTLATVTDDEGRFALAGLMAGTYRLLVSQAGYSQRVHDFQLTDGQLLTLPRSALWLVPMVEAQLPGLQVTGERIPVMMRPFYARRETGFGHFLTREEVAAKNPKTTYDVLRGVPGIVVRPNPRYSFGGDSQRYLIESLRMATINVCPMLIFMNGMRIGPSDTVDIDGLVSPNSVEAVEVYATTAGLPAQFNVPGAACGVIVLWAGAP